MEFTRLVVCIDVPVDNVYDAYAKLYEGLERLDTTDLEWESSDEWYLPDGELGDPDVLQDARLRFFELKEGKYDD